MDMKSREHDYNEPFPTLEQMTKYPYDRASPPRTKWMCYCLKIKFMSSTIDPCIPIIR